MFINNRLKIFCIITLFFTIIYIFLIIGNKIPFVHDTFQYLQLQYIYFNETVQDNSIPFWFPFVGQGSVGNYLFHPQISMFSPFCYLLGLLFKNINYLYLFYFSVWFDEFFFLIGVILLSSVYYKNIKTIFFVAITLLGTNIWYPQIWWNFHFYYWIPITLYCIHGWFNTKLFRYLIFSILFFSLTLYGNFIYAPIFSSFVLVLYILFLIPLEFKNIKTIFQNKIKFANYIILFLLLILFILSFSYITNKTDEITYTHNSTRDSSGKVTINTFLTYGEPMWYTGVYGVSNKLNKYLEIFRRYGSSRDVNIYAGFFLMPFVIIALLYTRKRLSYVVAGISLVIFLFSNRTFISIAFYYLYPFGSFFRHIGAVAPVCKLFLVFYAGFGFEEFLERLTDKKLIFFILAYQIIFLFWFIYNDLVFFNSEYFYYISLSENKSFSELINIVLVCNIVVLLCLFINNVKKAYVINILLLFIAIDLFSYKYSLIVVGMKSVPQSIINLFKPYKYNFQQKRFGVSDEDKVIENNQRSKVFYSFRSPERIAIKSTSWNYLDSFLFVDSATSAFRTDFLLSPIKQFSDIVKIQENKAHLKYSGIIHPKLDIFSKLNVVKNHPDELLINNGSFEEWGNNMPKSWLIDKVCKLEKEKHFVHHGKYSVKLISTLHGARLEQIITDYKRYCGRVVILKAFIRKEKFSNVSISIDDGISISKQYGNIPVGSFYQVFLGKKISPNAKKLVIYIDVNTVNAVVYVDSLKLELNEFENILNLEKFTADMLFTTEKDIKDIKNSIEQDLIQRQSYTDFKNKNERINANILVEKFSFNTLKLKVEVPGPPGKFCFLYYSDSYHPHWNAYVNGKKMCVIKSNIGYKSVMIPYGVSTVIFEFGNVFYHISIFCTILLGMSLFGLTIYIFIKEIVVY